MICTIGVDFKIRTIELEGKLLKLQIVRDRILLFFFVYQCGMSSSGIHQGRLSPMFIQSSCIELTL